MVQFSLKKVKVKDLREYHKNPRKLTREQAGHLRHSIEKYSLIDKPIINTDNTIVCGHMRLKVLKQMRKTEVECWVPDRTLDDKEVEELNIRHNKNTGDWDWDILANQWDADELVNYGFSAKEFSWGEDEKELPQECKKEQPGSECPNCGHRF